jgi:hypothetical protein
MIHMNPIPAPQQRDCPAQRTKPVAHVRSQCNICGRHFDHGSIFIICSMGCKKPAAPDLAVTDAAGKRLSANLGLGGGGKGTKRQLHFVHLLIRVRVANP